MIFQRSAQAIYRGQLAVTRTPSSSIYRQMLAFRSFAQVNVTLPDLGEGTKEATVKEFFVKVGDEVEEYQDLCEVFTDKLVAKIPSTATGKITAINYGDDDIIPVGHVIIEIDEVPEEGEVDAAEPATSLPAVQSEPVAQQVPVQNQVKDKVATAPPGNNQASHRSGSKALSTPAVRHLAKKEGVDINQVHGTGKSGRVTKTDLLAFIKSGHGTASQGVGSQPQGSSVGTVGSPKIAPLYGITEQDEVKKITGMKKAMTKTMTEALSIPAFTFSDEMDATALIMLRKEMKKVHTNLTMLPFFIKACSIAMSEYPVMNTHIDNDLDSEGYIQRYVVKHNHNFSIAIDSPDGLTVPNIKEIQNKSILQINSELKDLSVKAANGGLTKADFDDGTFSVSSVGNIGGRYFVPTILRPQAAIIAIGQAHRMAKLVDDDSKDDGFRIEKADMINFSISADHRVIDGATCARFGSRLKQLIENPNLMLLNMH